MGPELSGRKPRAHIQQRPPAHADPLCIPLQGASLGGDGLMHGKGWATHPGLRLSHKAHIHGCLLPFHLLGFLSVK